MRVTKHIPKVAVVLAALLAASVPAAGAGTSPQNSEVSEPASGPVVRDASYEGRGLGGYGPSGPIERSDLAADLDARVADRAIEMAMSPALAVAREGWDEEFDFVWQVDYQLRFRERVDYMSMDPGHIGRVLADRPANVGIESLGLILDGDEAREFNRRQALGDRIPHIREASGEDNEEELEEGALPDYGPNFAGVWQDQLGGGDIIVAVVDAAKVDVAAVERAVGDIGQVRIVEVEHSWDEIHLMRDALNKEITDRGLVASVLINSTGTGREFEIVTPSPELIDVSLLGLVPANLVTVSEEPAVVPNSSPSGTHSAADQQAGLQIEMDPGYAAFCTWGLSGHTSSYNYLVTDSHCLSSTYENFSGWSYVVEVQQNDVFELTPGPAYVYAKNVYNTDAARISSQYADSNCYHESGVDCGGFFRYRSLNNSWEVNSDMTCASLGTSNVYECGFIVEENYVETSPACEGNRWVRYGITTIGGDSGAGLVYSSGSGGQLAIDALHQCSNGAYGSVYFGMTAYWVKTELGFDYNCASSVVNSRAASAWGACPTINR